MAWDKSEFVNKGGGKAAGPYVQMEASKLTPGVKDPAEYLFGILELMDWLAEETRKGNFVEEDNDWLGITVWPAKKRP